MSIAVVRKTLAALGKLAESDEPLSLAVLSPAAQLPKPTAHRILQTLAALGYVAQEETGKYYLTTRARQPRPEQPLPRPESPGPIPAMNALHRQFNETVNLGVLEGSRVHYIHVIETSRSLRMMVQPNAADEYYFTAIGRAIAAHLRRRRRSKRSSSPPPSARSRQRPSASPKKLQKILRRDPPPRLGDRRRGVGPRRNLPAVSVFVDGNPAAAISVTMPKILRHPESPPGRRSLAGFAAIVIAQGGRDRSHRGKGRRRFSQMRFS